jgi:phage recombination protein Bet
MNALATTNGHAIAGTDVFTRDQLELLKRTIAMGTTDDEFKLFVATCGRLGLDPFARQIHCTKRKTKVDDSWVDVMSIQVGIDGFRIQAARTGKYIGQDGPYWCGPDGVWKSVWQGPGYPIAARVGVFRSDSGHPLWGVAHWNEYCQTTRDGKPNSMWARMPCGQLAKCAEALALRKAFPAELSGVSAPEEMGVPHEPERPAPRKLEQLPPKRSTIIDAEGTIDVSPEDERIMAPDEEDQELVMQALLDDGRLALSESMWDVAKKIGERLTGDYQATFRAEFKAAKAAAKKPAPAPRMREPGEDEDEVLPL